VPSRHQGRAESTPRPIQSQGIITRDNVSVDVSAVAYYRVVDATKSVVAIENVAAAINQIAQTTLRKVVGQHTLDQTLAETDRINLDIREILDGTTEEWGVLVTLVELKDIQLPETMKRAMARQAEAEREKRAKIIAAEGEALAADQLGAASDVMMAHPLALQLRNLQSLVEIGVDKNTTVVFPAPLMSTIQELGAFLAREQAAGTTLTPTPTSTTPGTPTSPASPTATSTGPAVERPATDAAFNTTTTERPRPLSLRADQAVERLGRTSGEDGRPRRPTIRWVRHLSPPELNG
jgi:SPFH domain / Band 7 family